MALGNLRGNHPGYSEADALDQVLEQYVCLRRQQRPYKKVELPTGPGLVRAEPVQQDSALMRFWAFTMIQRPGAL